MFKASKESGDYLSQIKNNIEEKVDVVEKSLQRATLPRTKEGAVKIIELGTGGGESLRKLQADFSHDKNFELVAVDVLPDLLSSLHKELGIAAVPGDAAALPFPSESVSAVNASAVLHEVSSYGTRNEGGDIIYGKEAVSQALSELNRILLPGGIVAYRDVLAPMGDLQSNKNVFYDRGSWKLFSEWFLRDFLKPGPHFYEQDSVKIETKGSGFSLNAPVGLQREFQRHYLMLRDYLRRGKESGLGIIMTRSEWLDKEGGLKSVTFSLDERMAHFAGKYPFEKHPSAKGNVYKGDSDQFDKLYDEVIEYSLEAMKDGDPSFIDFQKNIEAWKEREGLEYYLYGNIADVLNLAIEASQKTSDGYVLFPESPNDITVAPRFYYDRYLQQVADSPEKDGKQIIAFKKLTLDQALRSVGAMREIAHAGDGAISMENLEELEKKMSNVS